MERARECDLSRITRTATAINVFVPRNSVRKLRELCARITKITSTKIAHNVPTVSSPWHCAEVSKLSRITWAAVIKKAREQNPVDMVNEPCKIRDLSRITWNAAVIMSALQRKSVNKVTVPREAIFT